MLGPLYISGTLKARDFKFGAHIVRQACKPKNAKVGQEGRDLRHVTYFHNLGIHCIHISGTGEARDFKFHVQIERQACKPRNAKVGNNQSIKIYFQAKRNNYNIINVTALERLPEKHYAH